MSHFVLFDPATLPDPEYGAPDPARVIDGDPRFTVWTLEDRGDGRTYAGYWASTIGTWRVTYDEWEYCTLVEGHAVISEDGGGTWDLMPGQHFIFRPGFAGTWRVVEPVIKTFVVILPEPSGA